jgi:DNA replication protein DnaC
MYLTNDPEIYSKIMRNYNVLIIDEVSMLNNLLKEKIFKRYSNM